MGRTALNPPQTVRAAIIELLADQGVSRPVTPAIFRRAVSVRRLREKLGGGDPAALGRQIRLVQDELLQANVAKNGIDGTVGVPEPLVGHLRTLWDMALVAASEEFAGVRNEAHKTIEAAHSDRDNALALVEMLQSEHERLRRAESERERRIGELESHLQVRSEELAREQEHSQNLGRQLAETSLLRERERDQLEKQLEARRAEFDGLARRLLNDTDMQRQTFVTAQRALQSELSLSRQLIEQVTRERDQLLGDAAPTYSPVTRQQSRKLK
ncbi:DNA-binding protein [Paraburkholderia sp. J69-2]|nr:DNA-binding protein [Paraburkholderia sp. J69-2]